MPTKFTIEMDVLAGERGFYFLRYNDGRDFVTLGPDGFKTANASVGALPFWKKQQVQHVSISVSATTVKVYVGGKRYLNDPDALSRPISRLGLAFGCSGAHTYPGEPYDGIMITNFRLAEGGKDITQAINSEERIVTHGITFDSGSDRIRPESGPTLRKLLKLLQDDSGLAFEVQGHTDNQGGEKLNGPLSERRAAAVKVWLVAQGIEDGRLTTKGLGATKPLKANDTLEGRAENRRVEFVKRGG
jgi:outer membrane protein OmpA-like peptidoglycan-associated protein